MRERHSDILEFYKVYKKRESLLDRSISIGEEQYIKLIEIQSKLQLKHRVRIPLGCIMAWLVERFYRELEESPE